MINTTGYKDYKQWWQTISPDWKSFFVFNYQFHNKEKELSKLFEESHFFRGGFSEFYDYHSYYPTQQMDENSLKSVCDYTIGCQSIVPIGVQYVLIKSKFIICYDTSMDQLFDLFFLKELRKLDLIDYGSISGFSVEVFKLFPKIEEIGLAIEDEKLLLEVIRLKLPNLKKIILYGNWIHDSYGIYYNLEKELAQQSEIFKIELKIEYSYHRGCFISIEDGRLKDF